MHKGAGFLLLKFEKDCSEIGGLVNPIQDGTFWGCSRIWGTKSLASLKSSHKSYNDESWHSYTLPKEDSKNI